MQLIVNIDEKMFDGSIGEALKSLKPEDMAEMINNCVKEYLLSRDIQGVSVIEHLLLRKEKTYWGDKNVEPTFFTKEMFKQLDYSGLQDVVDKCIEELKTNYRDIIDKILLETMVAGMTKTCAFQDTVSSTVRDIIYQINVNRIRND